jgi:L-threonylcarbamoyladenylate synthase
LKTEILSAEDSATLRRAATALREGEPVALPTETVYGLAANALDARACARIFEAKERPLTDPLIVHLPGLEWLERIAVANDVAIRLAEVFWPGPLTVVLPRRSSIPDIVTAGQETVAVRLSAHPVFRQIAMNTGTPLAAPSANRFGRISPTTAEHVRTELEGRVGLIVDGGRCAHGIESTIVMVAEDGLRILRPGPISAEELAAIAPLGGDGEGKVVVPGSLKSHYAPRTPLDIESDPAPHPGDGLLSWGPVKDPAGFGAVEVLSPTGDPREVAANLYGAVRRLDAAGLRRIVALPGPESGLGAAIMDRLRKAAARG